MKNIIVFSIVLLFLVWLSLGAFTYSKLPNLSINSDVKNYVPTSISDLVIQTEDHRFGSHIGVDLYGIVRAWYYNLIHGQVVQWWSTIAQQLLKHYRWNYERTWFHKVQEAWWAIIFTLTNRRSAILQYYLTHVPFPNGWVVWYDAACRYYFDTQCDQLFESEILFLIAVAQDGSNPYRQTNFDRIKRLSLQICTKTTTDCSQLNQLSPLTTYDLSRHDDAIDPRTRMILQMYPSSIFDWYLNNQIEWLIQSNRALLEQHQAHDCCIVVIWPQWQIVSYNQCRSYEERVGTLDLCRTRRQTGSAIKPFIYAQAFEEFGYTGWTIIIDEPVSYDIWGGALYEPKNFNNQFHWAVTMAQSLGNSFNIPAIKLTYQLWVARVIAHINQLRYTYGQNLTWLELDRDIFTATQLWLSVWLGTYEMSPLEFARLWRYWYADSKKNAQRMDIISILSNPINRVISFGQDNLLNRWWWFVKTGTSRKFVDGRTCGGRIDHELIVCVWVGNHDVSSMDSSSVDTAWYLWYLTTQLLDWVRQ